ncbi:MAG TPA: amidase [Thermoleophilaceae bacterium]
MDLDLAFAGAARQAELLRDGKLSSRELVEGYLERIAEIEPRLNAFRLVYTERALAEADQADARLRAGDHRPLLGVPVAVKDNVDVAGDVTCHGTGTPREPASADSEVVRRLRAAGAVLIGRTHLPELAIWPITESQSYGITRNPWRFDRTCGGSSGGSAAAVAAGLAPVAVASDGGGSIRIPAACCGLFGIKPQRGRVSLAPLADHWHGLSVIGPVARRVEDAALFLDAVAEVAPETPFVETARRDPAKLRIAFSEKTPVPARMSDQVLGAMRDTAELLRSLGHEVVDHDPDYGEIRHLFAPRWLRGIYDDSRELVADPRQLQRRTRQMAGLGRAITPTLVEKARDGGDALLERLRVSTFDNFDVLITPGLAAPPVETGRWEGRGALRTFIGVANWTPGTATWNITGQPAVAVPAGFTDDGLPLSVQIVGRPSAESTLIALSAQIERERPWADKRPKL